MKNGTGISGISGISPEYFIKPDPLLTRQETRHYIRAALRSFLTGPALLRDAATLLASGAALTVEDLKTGRSPAGRLVVLARLLETEDLGDVGAVALAICQSHLDVSEDLGRDRGTDHDTPEEADGELVSDDGEEASEASEASGSPAVTETGSQENAESAEINHVALGFILTDLLPNGKTIRPYWDHSPFVALRSAPPLGSVRPSIDDLLEEAHQRFWRGMYTVCSGFGFIVPAVIPAVCIGYLAYKLIG
jgi:hypothetical protein